MHRRLTTTLLFFAICSSALGWGEAGHKITGSIAFRQLNPAEQARIVAILQKHPRYEEDFRSQIPAELTTDDEKNEWLFQQATVWADMARGLSGDARTQFNRPRWHYIDLPAFLTPEDEAALKDTLKENISLEAPEQEQEELDAVQVIRLARRLLADKDTPDEKKAVMLCWVFHLIGDIHQPLHSTALYSRNLFPTGDKGGNMIRTDQRQNLHSLWDQLPGQRADFRAARNRAITIVHDDELSKLGIAAAAALDEKTWLDESHALCEAIVYDPELTGYLRGYAGDKEAPPVTLTERYLKQAGGVAQNRVTQAGYRLGAVLKEIADQ